MTQPKEMGNPQEVYDLTRPRCVGKRDTSLDPSSQTAGVWRAAWVALAVTVTSACSAGQAAGPPRDQETMAPDGSDQSENPSGTGTGPASGSTTNASGGGGSGGGVSAGVSPSSASSSGAGGDTDAGSGFTTASEVLPARVRRLTRAEYDSSTRALLGTTSSPSTDFSFPPDTKHGPANAPAGPAFTVNDAQRVDPVLVTKLDAAALALVSEARASGKLGELSPCADPSATGGEACAEVFIRSFGASAYRRPLSDAETEGLLRVYHVGADGYTFEEGIDLVTRVLLQSPGFLYVTEIGEGGNGANFEMTANEIAASLSYLLTSGPPDAALLEAAASGALSTSEGREAEARRLLATTSGRERFVRVVREWLGIDDVAHREKSQDVYSEFADVSAAMEQESRAFIEEVLYGSSGTLTELLTADWTIVDPALAAIYGVSAAGDGERTSLASVNRRGILNQAAFLSVFATNNGSHPVFRGVALMRRIACLAIPDPGALGIAVSVPQSDASKTTRARFAAHAANDQCAGCHDAIDKFGFALENFDGIGRERTTENGAPVETEVTLAIGSDLDGTYADSTALLSAMANSDSVKTCLARQIFRSTAARSDASVLDAENAFIEIWKTLPAEQQGRLAEVLVAFIKTPTFIRRRTP
jgi:hypothetical protein